MYKFALDGGASLNTCRLEYGNGIFFPESEYESKCIEYQSKVRIFNDMMACVIRKNDYNAGTQLNIANHMANHSYISI